MTNMLSTTFRLNFTQPDLGPLGTMALYRLYLGIADGMSIARAWACRYPNRQPLGISPLATETGTSCSLLCFMRPKHEQPPKNKK